MRSGNAIACALLGCVILMLAGCDVGNTHDCPFTCISSLGTSFDLACDPNDLVSVLVTGPCAIPDASVASYTFPHSRRYVLIGAGSPGVCHVQLVFANGYTFSADVTFGVLDQGCGCPSYVGPVSAPLGSTPSGPITVPNPPSTCVAPPIDAGATD